jgi:hypothetical protein
MLGQPFMVLLVATEDTQQHQQVLENVDQAEIDA